MPQFDKSYYVKGALLIGDNYRGQIADIDQSPPTSPNTSLAELEDRLRMLKKRQRVIKANVDAFVARYRQ